VVYDFIIVGGGIVGLSVGMTLGRRYPDARVLILEKEDTLAAHQTGRNSGVIHSGIYYKPGSFKARFAREGSRSIVRFCEEHGIKHEVCGKVIVATESEELPLLDKLYDRGLENELPVRKIGPEELKEIEPHVRGLAGVHVPTTGIVDYKAVAATYARLIKEQGGEVMLSTRVLGVSAQGGGPGNGVVVKTDGGDFAARFLINCAGLHSDRLARMTPSSAAPNGARIVPFRGEYYDLKPEKRYLVKHLIYPVPNPNFPFLGVHFTRMIGGDIHAGPNAVLSFKREGYRKTDIDLRDLGEVMAFPGFWKLAGKYWKDGLAEIHRSYNKAAFVRSLQRLIPEIQADDVTPSKAGVRAQALMPDGAMVDDFLFVSAANALHVCNAPSPAATASLEIGKAVAAEVAKSAHFSTKV
jgi:L-2-hydroxyglutarate oxidase